MRACMKYLKEHVKESLLVAEIGVHCGSNAAEMLHELQNIRELYLIDPYVAYVDRDSSCPQWYIYDSHTVDLYQKAAEANIALQPEGNKAKFIRLPSLEAVQLFPEQIFDFVYIDAMHSRPHVDNDIRVWYPKIRIGGMLGGHDWGVQDVKDAVNLFAKEMNIKLQEELFETDWFIIK